MVCLATAHPAKFPESVDARHRQTVGAASRDSIVLEGAPTRRTVLPARVDEVKAFVAAHAR